MLYPKIAAALGISSVPTFMEGVAGVPELNLPDGLHPRAAGHERLADDIASPLAKPIRMLTPDAGNGGSE